MTEHKVSLRLFNRDTDLPAYLDWLAKDPTHQARYGLDGAKFLDGTVWTASNDKGEAVAFLRLSRVARIEMQFPPKEKRPVVGYGKTLRRGLYKLAAILKYCRFSEIVFESSGTPDSEGLKEFMKGLGFAESGYLSAPLGRK